MWFTFIFLVFLVSNSVSQEAASTLSPEVEKLCEDFFQWRIKSLPQFATFIGMHDYNKNLDDLSEEAYLERYNKSKEFLKKTEELEQNLNKTPDIINIAVLKDSIQTFLDGYEHKGHYLHISNLEGPHTDLEKLFGWMPKNSSVDYENIVSRMGQVGKQMDQMIALLRKGSQNGVAFHKVSIDNVANHLQKLIVEKPEDSFLYSFFSGQFPEDISEDQALSMQSVVKNIISNEIVPAFQRFKDFIENEYKPRSDIAAISLPNGEAFYNQCIKYHTSSNLSPKEIQELGFKQVAEIEEKMKQIVTELGYENMTVPEFSEKLRNDANNFYNNSEDVIKRFEEISFELIPPHLTKIFKSIPKAELAIEASPDADSPAAYYLTGAYDGTRPGVFYVNTFHPGNEPKYSMITLSLHEGNPGHHFQGSYSIESPTMPFFRRVADDRNYGLAPSTYPIHTAYIEGWGLYSESLGFDMNLYDDPLDRYGHYSAEIFRACRLVVDTGIHALGWTRDQAVDYMYTHTASTKTDIENEIDRYITWPGQALAYKIGQLKIRELRSLAEQELGDKFDIKDFHEVILDSVGPMDIVGRAVKTWMEEVQ